MPGVKTQWQALHALLYSHNISYIGIVYKNDEGEWHWCLAGVNKDTIRTRAVSPGHGWDTQNGALLDILDITSGYDYPHFLVFDYNAECIWNTKWFLNLSEKNGYRAVW